MYSKFKILLEEAEYLGKVVYAHMSENCATIDVVSDDGRKISLTMTLREEDKNDTV